ncbi:hypothetical protein D3C73_877120 [compost metagenome]
MFTLGYDAKKNRVHFVGDGIAMEDVPRYINELTEILKQVRPGFTGLTDLTGCRLLTQEVVKELEPTNELAIKAGFSTTKKWAYVTDSTLFRLQMKRMFGDFVAYFESYAEAEEYLSN